MTAQATTVQITEVEPAATNTTEANRIAELASYLNACNLVGTASDPALLTPKTREQAKSAEETFWPSLKPISAAWQRPTTRSTKALTRFPKKD